MNDVTFSLAENLSRDVTKASALEFAMNDQSQRWASTPEIITSRQDRSSGLGLTPGG